MLKKALQAKAKRATGRRVAIVASRYNPRYVNSMLRAAKAELAKARVAVEVVRVPGAFEIPSVASAGGSGGGRRGRVETPAPSPCLEVLKGLMALGWPTSGRYFLPSAGFGKL